MDELNALSSLGITIPTPAYLVGAIFFGIVGIAAFRYGRKMELQYTKWIGVALMLYPYLVSNTVLMYAVGAALCIALYIFRR